MLENLKNEFPNNKEICSGVDGRYHTVYLIIFETGQFYIGKHSSSDLQTDRYFCSSKLVNYMKTLDLSYHREILFYFQTAKDAITAETQLLSNKKYYDHTDNLNCYPGSPPDASGSIIISKGGQIKMINPILLDMHLENGWEKKGIKRVWINNGIDIKFILPSELDHWIGLGWTLGCITSRDRVFVEKCGKRKYIHKSLLEKYELDGWKKKHNVDGRKVLKKENHIIKVYPEDVQKYINNGYVPSSCVESLIYIKKDKLFKRIPEHQLKDYLQDGWVKGNNTSGKIYISNGFNEKRIYPDELSDYPDWRPGRLPIICLEKGLKLKKIYKHNHEMITKLLDEGFEIKQNKKQGNAL